MPISPWLRYFARCVGIPGIAGGILLLAATILHLSVTCPLRETIPQLQAQYAASRQNASQNGAMVRTHMTKQEKIAHFYGFFPQQHQILGWIGKLYEAAEYEKLQLVHGEYRTLGKTDKNPAPMRILLPVRGSYAQIRRFVATALAEIPFLALDGIDFQQSLDADHALEAKIRFVLYVRQG